MSLAITADSKKEINNQFGKKYNRESLVRFAVTSSVGLLPSAALAINGTGTPVQLATSVVVGLTAPTMYQFMRYKMAKDSKTGKSDPVKNLGLASATAMPIAASIIGGVLVMSNNPDNGYYGVASSLLPFAAIVGYEVKDMFKRLRL